MIAVHVGCQDPVCFVEYQPFGSNPLVVVTMEIFIQCTCTSEYVRNSLGGNGVYL